MNPYDYYISPDDYARAAANGISHKTLTVRIRRHGWDKERAMTQPVQRQQRSAWRDTAVANGVSVETFYARIRRGWTEERAATTPLTPKPQELAAAARRKYPPELHALRKQNGIGYHTFVSRIIDSGWEPLRAATEPTWTHEQTCAYGLQQLKDKYGENPNRFLFSKI